MPYPHRVQRAFSGGELAPDMFGRADDAKYQAGLARCRNFITTPHGPLRNRGGLLMVREAKFADKKVRLLPFVWSTEQTLVIEMGAGYFRFHTLGQTLVSGGAPYELAHPYQEAELFSIHTVQSADVLTLVHPNHPPRELRRLGALNWQLLTINFQSDVTAPTGLTATATGHTAVKYQYRYIVTAVSADGKSESPASAAVEVGGNLYETGGKVTLKWQPVAGASRYRAYKEQGGLFGYIGQTETLTQAGDLSLIDDNIEADLSKTPPRFDSVFQAAGDYPGAVSYFEQRRCFAGTDNQPQNLWLTRSGTESNMSYSLPSLADDRIALRVAAREASRILHMVPLNQLILLTASAEWLVSTADSDALTNTTISVRPQSYIGASDVQPVVINNSLIYCAARGGHVRELGYNWQAGGFISGDLSLRAAHLFDDLRILDMAYSQAPFPILWCVSSDGQLLGLTYIPEQEVGGWHVHETLNGRFESICVVPEGERDVLYALVNRQIGGQQKRFIERMGGRHEGAQAFFVDCGASYEGAPATTISGLSWLNGETVSILADGAVVPPQVVANGQIHLPKAAKVVHMGLPITAQMVTLPMTFDLDDGSGGSGRVKNINQIWLRVQRSGGFEAGALGAQAVTYKPRSQEPTGTPPPLITDNLPLTLHGLFQEGGQLILQSHEPLPFSVVSLTAEVAF